MSTKRVVTPVGAESSRRIPRQRSRSGAGQVQVLVAVGTDKHPFDRLVDWLRGWQPTVIDRVALTLQHGHTAVADVPGAVAFLGHDELQAAMSAADLVVCHGGPATILEARRHGRVPIVVPRDPSHGEHVDDHQLRFARRLGAAGLVVVCETRAAFLAALTAGLAEPSRFVVRADPDAARAREAAVARVGEIVEDLVVAANGRRAWGRPWSRSPRRGARG